MPECLCYLLHAFNTGSSQILLLEPLLNCLYILLPYWQWEKNTEIWFHVESCIFVDVPLCVWSLEDFQLLSLSQMGWVEAEGLPAVNRMTVPICLTDFGLSEGWTGDVSVQHSSLASSYIHAGKRSKDVIPEHCISVPRDQAQQEFCFKTLSGPGRTAICRIRQTFGQKKEVSIWSKHCCWLSVKGRGQGISFLLSRKQDKKKGIWAPKFCLFTCDTEGSPVYNYQDLIKKWKEQKQIELQTWPRYHQFCLVSRILNKLLCFLW